MRNVRNNLALLIFALVFSSNFAFSQGNVILLQGKTTDVGGGPASTKIRFVSSSGKAFTCASNSIDGSYQQVLPPDDSYILYFEGYTATDDVGRSITLPPISTYTEMTKNFKIKKIEKGMVLLSAPVFERGDSLLSESGKKSILDLKQFIIFQKKLEMNLGIDMSDCPLPAAKAKPAKAKKGKAAPVTAPAADMFAARVSALKNFFSENGIREKSFIFSKNDSKPAADAGRKKSGKKGKSAAGGAKNQAAPSIQIVVERVMDI